MGNIFERRAFKLAEIHLGSLALRDVVGNEFRFLPDRAPPGRTGHVGLASLNPYLLVVNFSRSELQVRATGDFALECGTGDSRLIIGEHGIASEFHTESGSLLLGWDTAAQANILKPATLGLGQAQFKMDELRELRGAVGTSERSDIAFRLMDIQIPGLDGLLGYDYFNRHVVCLDLPVRRVRIKRRPD